MNQGAGKPERVCAIIVTYHPQLSIIENVERLRPQVTEIVVIDNGSAAKSEILLSQLEKIPGLRIIRNAKNLGIAAALNTGIKYAGDAHYDWVATFDQDSTVTPDFVSSMFAAYESCPFKNEVALISPIHCVSEEEWKKKHAGRARKNFSLIRVAMTSGSLIKASAFLDTGLYDEGMFIDYVDFDFCLRLWQHGYKLVRSCRSCLLHHLGALEAYSFLGFPITITSHSALRRYYIMRNRIIMYRRYTRSFPVWVLKDFGWLLLDVTKIVMFEHDKGAKLRHALKGIRHGLAGVSGPMAQSNS